MNIRIGSPAWNASDCPEYVSYRLELLGFRWSNQLLDLRIFDLLNMNQMDNNTAEELLYHLYKLLNPSFSLDDEIYYGFVSQPFSYAAWRSANKHYANATVRDIVMAEGMNSTALSHLFRLVSKAFYKSEEYNSRKYRYSSEKDLHTAWKSQRSS